MITTIWIPKTFWTSLAQRVTSWDGREDYTSYKTIIKKTKKDINIKQINNIVSYSVLRSERVSLISLIEEFERIY